MSVFDPVIFSELQRLAKSMADTLAALATSVTSVGTDVAVVSGKVTTVNTAVGTVSGQVTGVNNAVAALQGTANNINATVAAINAAGGTKGIKSVQRGVFAFAGHTSLSAAIAAVNVSKTELRYVGGYNNGTPGYGRLSLTNSTTVTCDIGAGSNGLFVGWELTEWN